MAKILFKKQLSPAVFQFRVEAPLIAQERKAGQFIILQTNKDNGERVPPTANACLSPSPMPTRLKAPSP